MPYLLALLSAPMTAGWLIAQSNDSPGFEWGALVTQLGIATGAVWWAVRAEKRSEVAETRQREAEARERDTVRQAEREKQELLERLVPLIVTSTAAIEATQKGMERQVEKATEDVPPRPRELREALERITESLDRLAEERLDDRRRR